MDELQKEIEQLKNQIKENKDLVVMQLAELDNGHKDLSERQKEY